MRLAFNPAATESFDARAAQLVPALKVRPPSTGAERRFPVEIPSKIELTDSDMSSLELFTVDRGVTIERWGDTGSVVMGLSADAYRDFAELAEAIRTRKEARKLVGQKFIEDALFRWLLRRHAAPAESPSSFTMHLADLAELEIGAWRIWTPLLALQVEHQFDVAHGVVTPLSEAHFDGWRAAADAANPENRSIYQSLFDKYRGKYLGRAALVHEYLCEPGLAADRSDSDAETDCSLLAVLSPAVFTPGLLSQVRPVGALATAPATFAERDGAFDSIRERATGSPGGAALRLTSEMIAHMRPVLDRLSQLASADSLSDFQSRFLNAVLLYSRAAFVADETEKAIAVLTALESLLLKDSNESIGSNLAVRLALVVGSSIDERKAIDDNVRVVYDVRSKYLHHGDRSVRRTEAIARFLWTTFTFFHTKALAATQSFRTAAEWVQTIDDRKFTGP